MPQPHHPPSWGRVLAALGTTLALYVIMGVITLEPTQRILIDRCYAPVHAGPHVALWPFSILALSRLPHKC